MIFLSNILKGIAIGAGAIIPGVSSGVLCVILGIYEKLISSILDFFKDLKNNIKFLLPILIGGIIGVLIFSNVLNYLLYVFPLQTKSIFIGLILGSIPKLMKEVNKKQKFKLHYLIYTIIALVIGIAMVFLEDMIITQTVSEYSFIYLIISGLIMSIGIVVPGVSSTVILMLLGVYNIYLASLANLFLPILIPIFIGIGIGGLIFMRVTKFLMDRFYAQTFYTILGFSLGSILILMPEVSFDISGIICILCIALGFIVVK